jgi:hypothetical protein
MNLLAQLDATLNNPLRHISASRAVGTLGGDIPIELILAADALPTPLGATSERRGDLSLADRFLESSFSLESRIVAQQWLSGELDALQAVVFSRSDDSAQRLYYYICELQRMGECGGPRPLIYDIARIARSSSLAHTVESTKLLAAALGVHDDRLPAATQRVAARARLLKQLLDLRASNAAPPGSVAHRIVRAARLDWSEQFERSLRAWLTDPLVVEPAQRVLLVGSAPVDERLHLALETDGNVIVGEINEAPQLIANEQPDASVEAIAQQVYLQTRAARGQLQLPSEIVRTVRALRVGAVIVSMRATDTGIAWEAPRIEQALREAGVPLLMLTSQPDNWDEQTLARVTQFVRGVAPR